MKTLLLFFMLMTTVPAFAQEDGYDVLEGNIYRGKIEFKDLESDTYPWFSRGVVRYRPDSAEVAFLAENLRDYDLVVFLGTWCEDSHIQIPKLYSVLQAAEYPLEQVRLYALDMSKQGKNGEEMQYGVSLVPAIIVEQGGKEIGRIGEVPSKNIEADLAAVIRGHRN